jgi:hypothetical protein
LRQPAWSAPAAGIAGVASTEPASHEISGKTPAISRKNVLIASRHQCCDAVTR